MPRKPEYPDGAKTRTINTRTTAAIRAQLEAAAVENGRSLVQEVEFRLLQSLDQDRIERRFDEALALLQR